MATASPDVAESSRDRGTPGVPVLGAPGGVSADEIATDVLGNASVPARRMGRGTHQAFLGWGL